MELLNGKAEKDFKKWLSKTYPKEFGYVSIGYEGGGVYIEDVFESKDFPETCKKSLIIEWLSTLKYKGQDLYIYCFDFFYKHRIESQTINDINIQAITKAVDTFNLN